MCHGVTPTKDESVVRATFLSFFPLGSEKMRLKWKRKEDLMCVCVCVQASVCVCVCVSA